MKIGYARVSTTDQNLDLQLAALKEAGCGRIFQEKISGAKKDRPELQRLMDHLRPGDVVVVWKLDRLARSTHQLLELVEHVRIADASFCSLSEPWADTTTHAGKMIMTVFAGIAEFERDLIRERTDAGLKAARARGRMGGRPSLLDERQIKRMIEMYEEQKNTVAEICKIYEISRPSFYNYLSRHKSDTDLTKNKPEGG